MATIRITKQVNSGDSYTVQATPNSGYSFTRWTSSGSQVSTNNPYTSTPNSSILLNAEFQSARFTITTSVNNSSYGTVSGGGTYNGGSSCTLTATPKTGYSFTTWQDLNTSLTWNTNPYTFTVDSNRSIEALFTAKTGSITNLTVSGYAYDTYAMGSAYLKINNTQIAEIYHGGGKVSITKTGTYPKTFQAGDLLVLDCTRMYWSSSNRYKLKIRYSSNNYLIEASSATTYSCSLNSWAGQSFSLSAGLY